MTGTTTRGHWHIPWLRGLPADWEVVSSKQLFSARKELAREQDQQLAATQAYGVISQKEFERRVGRRVVQITQNLEKRRHVEKDDFVISMRSFQGGLERAWETGCIRSSYVVLKPSDRVDVGFFQHVFKSHDYIQALQATSNFIRDGQDLNISNFSLVDLPLPPKEEQRLLARFLDWHGGQTAKMVGAKKKIIALLNEQKQAIIHRAVTRGLDPKAKLKPSGIPWLGDVPEVWEVRKLASLFKIAGSGTTPSGHGYYDGDIPWVMSGDLNNGVVKFTKRTVTDFAIKEVSALRVYPKNSLIIAMYGATIGKTGVLAMEACTNQACCVLALPRATVNIDYVQMFVNLAKLELVERSYGGGQPNINAEIVKALRIPVPPIEQQEEILRFVRSNSEDVAINKAEREIALIQEFRTRLIADVVTGKLDVRAAAASLPETTEPEPIDDLGEVDDLEEGIDDTENEEVAA